MDSAQVSVSRALIECDFDICFDHYTVDAENRQVFYLNPANGHLICHTDNYNANVLCYHYGGNLVPI